MRILLVSGIFPPDIGGPARYLPRLAFWLQNRGHAVEVVTLAENPGMPASFSYPVLRLRRRRLLPFRMVATVAIIAKAAWKSDLIYSVGLDLEAALAAKLTGRRHVMRVGGDPAWERACYRGWFSDGLEEYQTARKNFRLKILDWLRALPTTLAKRIIVPSRYLGKITQGWGAPSDRIRVVFNAVESDPKASEVLQLRDRLVISTACRLAAFKGVDGILRVLRKMPKLDLRIAGDGPDRGRLEKLTDELGLRERVRFLGSIPAETVASLMRESFCFVLNSSGEGSPNVLLEAMAAGTPVVATRVGGSPELVEEGETGLLIPSGDDAALEQAIQKLISTPGLRGNLIAAAGRRIREKFSPDVVLAETERVLLHD